MGTTRLPALIAKVLVLSGLDALAIWGGIVLVGEGLYWLSAALVIGVLFINWTFLHRAAYPLRYILPSLVFFVAMTVYPLVYTVRIAFTNYGAGHFLTKEQVIEILKERDFLPPDHLVYRFRAFQDGTGRLKLVLSSPSGEAFLAEDGSLRPVDPGDPRFGDEDRDGLIDRIDGFRRLTRAEVARNIAQLQGMRFVQGEYIVKLASLDEFWQYRRRYSYDPIGDAVLDIMTGVTYRPRDGSFTSATGERLSPGFRTDIGLRNFYDLIANPQVTGPFFRVFVWTFVFAGLSVATTFALGLLLALVLNDPALGWRKVYRSLLILPWAIPGFISILIWAGMFNTEVGIINQVLMSLGINRIPWFQEPLWAMAALILVNLWLGFPYMMTISLGALQSIPHELYEAARVDGATSWQRFRKITFPLLMVSLAPLLVGSFAFNFNNFTVIYLLTGGGPSVPGEVGVAGATDILISYTYKLAFAGGRGTQYGFAAAISVVIAVIIGTISLINFKLAGTFEEVRMDV